MPESPWLPLLVACSCLMLTEVNSLTCHVCKSVIGNQDADCEGAPNSPRACMATDNEFCLARVAFVGDILSSVVRACSETCEPDYLSCLQEHGECTLCCDTNDCNSRSAVNVATLLATGDPPTATPPSARNTAEANTDYKNSSGAAVISDDDRDPAVTYHAINRDRIAIFVACALWVSFNCLNW